MTTDAGVRRLARAIGAGLNSPTEHVPHKTKGNLMSDKFQFTAGIVRSSSDHLPSPHELYYKHFDDNIHFVQHTGITDRYGPSYDDDDDRDDEDMPGKGMEYLEKEIAAVLKVITEAPELIQGVTPTIYKYVNYESNVFIAIIMLLNVRSMVQIRISPTRKRTMTAFTIFSDKSDREGLEVLKEYSKQFIAPAVTKKDKIHIITQSNNDFYLKDIELSNKKSKFSFENYNEGFEELSDRLIKTLHENNESGLVLFHGDPGTGKTSYLKHLLHTIGNKKLIYMPPDLTEHLSSPGFITFMMSEATNSILLIEDAENVLRHREAGGNQAVSNILNLSDGILGDVLKLQIVCTFNSKLDEIDPALLRPGRCIAEYRFEKLAEDRACALMAKLHGEAVEFEPKDMTLAEVFNFKKPNDRTKDKKQKVGFI